MGAVPTRSWKSPAGNSQYKFCLKILYGFDCPLLFPFLCSVVNWSMAIPTRCTPAVRLELDNEANHPNICKQRIPLKIIPFMENYGATGKGTYYLIP